PRDRPRGIAAPGAGGAGRRVARPHRGQATDRPGPDRAPVDAGRGGRPLPCPARRGTPVPLRPPAGAAPRTPRAGAARGGPHLRCLRAPRPARARRPRPDRAGGRSGGAPRAPEKEDLWLRGEIADSHALMVRNGPAAPPAAAPGPDGLTTSAGV